MKKLLLSFLIITSIVAFAYTQVDVDNANYLANKNIITQQSTAAGYRLNDTITRAEVAGTALKLRGTTLPEWYLCKKYFSDTIKNDWICRATELAADAGLVSRANATFRPQDKITRAEAFAIIYKSSGIQAQDCGWGPLWFKDVTVEWQKKLLYDIACIGQFRKIPWIKSDSTSGDLNLNYIYPNRDATRAEVFGFAKNILEYKAMMSGEVNI